MQAASGGWAVTGRRPMITPEDNLEPINKGTIQPGPSKVVPLLYAYGLSSAGRAVTRASAWPVTVTECRNMHVGISCDELSERLIVIAQWVGPVERQNNVTGSTYLILQNKTAHSEDRIRHYIAIEVGRLPCNS